MMARSKFTPGGRTHKVLRRLARAPALPGALLDEAGYPKPCGRYKRKKFWLLLDHLRHEGLTVEVADRYREITPAGLRVLDEIDRAEDEAANGVPNVRIFARAA